MVVRDPRFGTIGVFSSPEPFSQLRVPSANAPAESGVVTLDGPLSELDDKKGGDQPVLDDPLWVGTLDRPLLLLLALLLLPVLKLFCLGTEDTELIGCGETEGGSVVMEAAPEDGLPKSARESARA